MPYPSFFNKGFILQAGCIFCFLCLSGCAVSWTKAIRYGQVAERPFREEMPMETREGLIFLPVTIKGQTYRFLFDTGAPFSISEELQKTFRFDPISKGHIVDSDHNRNAVTWVTVDTIHIGRVPFSGLSAFVGSFDTNPLLKCLEIDGIIGSNLIRHCNWTIDPETRTLTLSSFGDPSTPENTTSLPFRTDEQYNIFIDLNVGNARVKNVLVDYGSNGSVALNKEIFNILKERSVIGHTYLETGVKQSGIVGTPVPLNRETTWSVPVSLEEVELPQPMIRTGETVSVGNQLLSEFRVHLNWENQRLYLTQVKTRKKPDHISGFKLGYSEAQGVFVQSVFEQSDAYRNGLRPMMKVLQIGSLNLENATGLCDYIELETEDHGYLKWIDTYNNIQEANLQPMHTGKVSREKQ